jgi:hypothetical protein
MAKLTYKDNMAKYIANLQRLHGAIPVVSANTVNTAAKLADKKYKESLKSDLIIRNKFTLNAVKIFKAKAIRSSGEFRQIQDINAIAGVRKLRGGKDHYLLKHEIGGVTRGGAQTDGKVAKPLDATRTSENLNRPIKRALRLQQSKIQTLTLGGRAFGKPGDGFKASQRWAILEKYKKSNPYGWDLKQQFYFVGMKRGLGAFQQKGKRFRMLRKLDDTKVNIRGLKNFTKSMATLTPSKMELIFKRESQKIFRLK